MNCYNRSSDLRFGRHKGILAFYAHNAKLSRALEAAWMLDKFTVKDFKSLADIELQLGQINVFVGANGSGKSNLLEAIGILGAAASGRVNDETLKHRGVRPGLPALYKSSFKNNPPAMHIRLEAEGLTSKYGVTLLNPIKRPTPEWEYRHEQLTRGNDKIVGRSPRSMQQLNMSAGLAALKVVELVPNDPAAKLMDLLRNYAIYSPDTPTLRGLEPDPQAREPVGLAGGRLPEGVLGLTKSRQPVAVEDYAMEIGSLVDWLQRFGVTYTSRLPISESVPQPVRGLRFVDKYMGKGRDVLSGYDASEGVLYLFFCTVLALHPKSPRLFAIDNFDQALNPRTARDFTVMFCRWLLEKGDRQALLTTHNPLVLDGLPLSDPRVRLFAVDRSKRGHTVIEQIEINALVLKSAQKGIPLSQQWVMGHFGGVPSSV